MIAGFEFLLAGRYLRAHRPKGALNHLRWLTLGLLIVTIAVYVGDELAARALRNRLSSFLWDLRGVLRYMKYVTVLLTLLVGFFVELIRNLTIFTTISTFGLFLGTGALITVVSVMSGFEQDLKTKILGTHAHMVVTTPDRSFTDYRDALTRIESVPGVVAATPYLTSEVMVASQSNLAGVIIKGIDPASIGLVTDLVRNTDQGSLDNLVHPERILLGQSPGHAPPPPLPDAPDGGAERRDGGAPGDLLGPPPAAGKAAAAEAGEHALPPPPRPRPRKVLPGVVIGRELAKNLRVFVGDDVSVVSPMGDIGPTGPIPKAKPFRVAAIFFSGMYEYDSKYVYMALPSAQKFLGLGDEVTGLELKLRSPEDTEPVMDAVAAAVKTPGGDPKGPGGGFEVSDWKQLNRALFSALKLEKIAMFIALCFIILVAAFSIVSNGIMLVLEKGREVAILKSMGASDGAVMRVFVLLGLYMGVVGTAFGVLTGFATCAAFDRFGLPLDSDVYYITNLPVKVHPTELVIVALSSLLLSLLATLYPAWLAARLRPVEGLKG